MNEKEKRVITVSLSSSLIAVILFIFGLTLSKGIFILDFIYSLISILILFAAVLALYRNNINKRGVFRYLIMLNTGLIALIVAYLFINYA